MIMAQPDLLRPEWLKMDILDVLTPSCADKVIEEALTPLVSLLRSSEKFRKVFKEEIESSVEMFIGIDTCDKAKSSAISDELISRLDKDVPKVNLRSIADAISTCDFKG